MVHIKEEREREREREKEREREPEHTAGPFQNKGTEQFPRRASQLRTSSSPPEAGGSGDRKGVNSAPETAPPTKLQTGSQFLIKDFLRFWMVDIRREGHG